MPRSKLTLSINKRILEAAKQAADQKHIPLSRLVENFLEFFLILGYIVLNAGQNSMLQMPRFVQSVDGSFVLNAKNVVAV